MSFSEPKATMTGQVKSGLTSWPIKIKHENAMRILTAQHQIPMINWVECWSVILTDQAKDVILNLVIDDGMKSLCLQCETKK